MNTIDSWAMGIYYAKRGKHRGQSFDCPTSAADYATDLAPRICSAVDSEQFACAYVNEYYGWTA